MTKPKHPYYIYLCLRPDFGRLIVVLSAGRLRIPKSLMISGLGFNVRWFQACIVCIFKISFVRLNHLLRIFVKSAIELTLLFFSLRRCLKLKSRAFFQSVINIPFVKLVVGFVISSPQIFIVNLGQRLNITKKEILNWYHKFII